MTSVGNRSQSLGGSNSFYEPPGGDPSPRARQNRAMSQDPGYRTGPRPQIQGNPTNQPSLNGYDPSPNSKYSNPQGIGNDQRYRYTDYKPVPPPKSSVYKPVPPPKPKTYQPPPPSSVSLANGASRGSVPMMGTQQSAAQSLSQPNSYISEGNYMNSGQVQAAANGGYATSVHYHSTQVCPNISKTFIANQFLLMAEWRYM